MSTDEFTKLFNYLNDRFNSIDTRFDNIDARLDKMQGSIDGLVKWQEISDDERLVMGHQLDRLNKWVHAVAKEIGYSLKV